MRHLRQFCAVATLLCAFSFPTYAGNIPCPAVIQPQPDEITSETQSDATLDSTITDALLIFIEGVFLAV